MLSDLVQIADTRQVHISSAGLTLSDSSLYLARQGKEKRRGAGDSGRTKPSSILATESELLKEKNRFRFLLSLYALGKYVSEPEARSCWSRRVDYSVTVGRRSSLMTAAPASVTLAARPCKEHCSLPRQAGSPRKSPRTQAHLDICRYDAVTCPNQCPARLSRLSLDEHLDYTCPRRRVVCEHCSQEFLGEFMETSHLGNCPVELVWCENKCGAKLERRFLSNHMRNECHKRTVRCQYCSREFVQETLQTHQYQCPRYPVPCPNRCDPSKIPREDLDVHVQELCPSATITCPFSHAGCKYKCPRFSLDRHLEEEVKMHLSLMGGLVRQQQRHISRLVSTLHTVTQVTDGTFVWKISDYKAKYIDALYKSNKELTSPPFYTSRHGYKAALSLFLNGNGGGEGKYLSLYIKLLPGEYDNILEWPFLLPVSFTIYDQCKDLEARQNISESFTPDPTWQHFQRPLKDEDSMGFGFPKFVKLDVLKTKDYIRDDSLVIKVCVDNSRFILP